MTFYDLVKTKQSNWKP